MKRRTTQPKMTIPCEGLIELHWTCALHCAYLCVGFVWTPNF